MRIACSLIAAGLAGFVVGVLAAGCGGRSGEPAARAQAADTQEAALRPILFVGRDASRTRQVFVINADGTARKQLTHMKGYKESPHWSPDGTRVVFMVGDGGVQGIWTVKSDGTGAKRLVPDDGVQNPFDPSW